MHLYRRPTRQRGRAREPPHAPVGKFSRVFIAAVPLTIRAPADSGKFNQKIIIFATYNTNEDSE